MQRHAHELKGAHHTLVGTSIVPRRAPCAALAIAATRVRRLACALSCHCQRGCAPTLHAANPWTHRGSTATELERVPPQPTGCAHYHACGAPVPEGASGRPAQESMDTRGAVPERQPRTPPMRPITTDLEYRRPHRGRGAAHPSTHAHARARAHTHTREEGLRDCPPRSNADA